MIWRRDGSEGIRWWLRGIRDDGSFYGDVRWQSSDPGRSRGTSVRGTVPPSRLAAFRALLDGFSASDPLPPGPCFALLARAVGPGLNDSEIVFQYDRGDEDRAPEAAAFLELKAILEAQIGDAYEQLIHPE